MAHPISYRPSDKTRSMIDEMMAYYNNDVPGVLNMALATQYRKYQQECAQMKYYPILLNYVGPNPDSMAAHLRERIYISRTPGRKNLSREECIDGWLGQTNDRSECALGEFDADGARQLLKSYGVQIPDNVPVRFTDYSIRAETSEWYNKQFAYPSLETE